MLKNNLLIDAIHQNTIPYTPVWLMRQAGRYLPEYRKVRSSAGSFLNLCKTPDLATEVTLQPLRRFNLDAAILFSDILVIPEAMGMELDFVENEGPKFNSPIISVKDIDNLNLAEITQRLNYVFQTIRNIKSELNSETPLIGFSGSPFTLACYMLEGGASKNYLKIKQWLYSEPVLMHKLLAKLSKAIVMYLKAQIEAGVDLVMLFDSWGGVLSPIAYSEFSLFYMKKIIEDLNTATKVPKIVFTKGGGVWLNEIATSGADVIGLDWTTSISDARKTLKNISLQGNLDPGLLAIGDKDSLKREVAHILNSYKDSNDGKITGHIFNLGHGILPTTNPDSVAYLVDLVHELSRV